MEALKGMTGAIIFQVSGTQGRDLVMAVFPAHEQESGQQEVTQKLFVDE